MKRFFCMLIAAIFMLGAIGGAMAEGEEATPEPVVTDTPADTVEPVDSTAPETEDPNVTVEPVDSTDPNGSEDPNASADPTEAPADSAAPETTDPNETADPNGSAEPEGTEDPADPAEPENTDTAEPGDYVTMAEGDWRVVMGADLNDQQRAQIFALFGLSGELPADKLLTVTNAEERFYFEGKMPSSEIGTRSLSCIYICAQKKGSGLNITTHNIDYCTEDMYRNVLLTVGITDARIIVAAPTTVSGTAALTGVYKAYESLTGNILSEYAKLAGIDELIATGELAEMIGSEEATEIINELKKILDVTKDMDDEAVKQKIREIAQEYGVELNETQVQQILTLSRTLEGLDVEQIRQRALGLVNAANGWQKFTQGVSNVVADIGNFFKNIAQFFKELFEKWFS